MSDLHDHRKSDNTSDLFELKARVPEYVCFVLFFWSILKTNFYFYITTECLQ